MENEAFSKLDDPKYKDQGYAPGTKVEIDSALFTDFTNLLNSFVLTAEKVQVTATSIAKAMGYIVEESSKLQLRVLEQHLDNVDKGLTVDASTLDVLDAEVKIEETKEG